MRWSSVDAIKHVALHTYTSDWIERVTIQALLFLAQKATENVSASDLAPEDQFILKRFINSAKEPLEELDRLIAVCLRDANTDSVGSGTRSSISFTAWVRSRRSVGALKKRIVSAHHNIGTALAALSNIRGRVPSNMPRSNNVH